MTDTIVTLAKARLAWHHSEAAKLEDFLATYADLTAGQPPIVPVSPPAKVKAAKPPKAKHRSQTQMIYDGVRAILDREGAPVRLKDLVTGLASDGLAIQGKSPAANLSARLGQSPYFLSIKDVGWWFKDRAVPHPKGNGALPFESALRVSSEGGALA